MNIKVLILGAGYGTRLQRDLKQSSNYQHLLGIPKALLPLGGRDALITHWLELFEKNSIKRETDIYVVTNDASILSFQTWAKNQRVPSQHIVSDKTTTNENRLGAVPDIQFGIRHFGLEKDHVLVVGGDTLFLNDFDFSDFLMHHQSSSSSSSLVTTYKVNDDQVHKFGIIEVDDHGIITSFLEKPSINDTTSRQACPCFYLFHPNAILLIDQFLDDCKKKNLGLDHYDATGKCLSYLYPRHQINTYPISGRIDVGGLQSYIDANQYFNSEVE
ncbi:unnamed protein product [Cunninghamella blakesleeana]